MTPTFRLKIVVAYDGRPFRGWQSQAGGTAVQDHLEAAFQKIASTRIVVHGSGRTDSGVHALAQVAHADVPTHFLPPAKWLAALKANLPPELRVLRSTRAPQNFHSRFQARGKVYRYRLFSGPIFPPHEIGRAWHVQGLIDPALLLAGSSILTGTHDFAGFAANRGQPPTSTIRTLHSITLSRRGPLFTLQFPGNGFLYKMVRLLTGTLVRCSLGRMELSHLSTLLLGGGNPKTHFQAPAEGLTLVRVLYGKGFPDTPGTATRELTTTA